MQRDQLIAEHATYVRGLAARVKQDIGGDVDQEELVAYGMQGLVEAAGRYDPTRGASFTTFSYYRIRGAIFDGLRKQGWLSRSQYARYQESSNALLQHLSDQPSPSPDTLSTGSTLTHIAQTLDQAATIFVMSLEQLGDPDLADPDGVDADAALDLEKVRAATRDAVLELPERERKLIELYYFQDMTLEAAGRQLGLSKSWTSRLHARAIKLLTDRLGPSFER